MCTQLHGSTTPRGLQTISTNTFITLGKYTFQDLLDRQDTRDMTHGQLCLDGGLGENFIADFASKTSFNYLFASV